uniref:Uncharacterized protein n=1 Tax=Knipowitschia caucasica TaxID=637954 RepID=A0AAV2JZN3_KNICA
MRGERERRDEDGELGRGGGGFMLVGEFRGGWWGWVRRFGGAGGGGAWNPDSQRLCALPAVSSALLCPLKSASPAPSLLSHHFFALQRFWVHDWGGGVGVEF